MTHTSRNTSLFLLEMILVIFFFSVSATVCARLFVQSHLYRTESLDLTRAVMEAQNAAESFYAARGDVEGYTIHYDDQWNRREEEPDTKQAAYELRLIPQEAVGGRAAQITVIRMTKGEPELIFDLPVFAGGHS